MAEESTNIDLQDVEPIVGGSVDEESTQPIREEAVSREIGEIPVTSYDIGIPMAPQEDVAMNRLILNARRGAPRRSSTGSEELDNLLANSVDPSEYGVYADSRPRSTVTDVDPNDYYATLSSGKQVSRYKEYIPGIDNRERLAQMQTRGEKWGNSLKKFGIGVGAAIGGGTVGLVSSTLGAITGANSDILHDNAFSDWAYELNEKMEYTLPVYTTQEYEDKSLFQQMGHANFWANDVLGGSTFTVGMLASEAIWAAATRGTSLLTLGARAAARTARAAGMVSRSSRNIGRGVAKNTVQKTKEAAKKLINDKVAKDAAARAQGGVVWANRAKGALNTGRQIYTSAFYEAQMEAKFFIEETREDYVSEFEYRNGRKPNATEMREFERDLMDSANYVTAANIALVGGTNLMTFGRFLTGARHASKYKNNMLRRSLFGEGFDKAKDGSVKALKPNNFQKVAGRVYGFAKPVVSEGFIEEAGQNVIGTTANEFIMAAHDPGQIRESIDLVDAFYEGMKEAYGTKEGQKEILVGGIVGLLFGGAQSRFRFNEVSQNIKEITEAAKVASTVTYENLMNETIYSAQARKSAEMAKEAARKGDMVGVEMANGFAEVAKMQRDHMFGGVLQGVKDYKAYLQTQMAQIQEDLGVDAATAEQIIEDAVNTYSEKASEYVKNREYAEALFGDRDIVEFNNSNIQRETIIAATAAYLTINRDADIRATETINQIKQRIQKVLGTTEQIRSMDTMEALRRIDRNAYQRYRRASKKLEALEKKKENIENRLARLNSTRELNEKEASEREKLLQEYNKTSEKVEKELAEKNTAYNALGLEGITERTVTQEDLDKQDERLKALTDNLENLRKTNPVLAQEIETLINEYQRSVEHAKTYSEMVEMFTDPNLRLTKVNNWATKMFKGKRKLEDSYAEFFLNLQRDFYSDGLGSQAQTERRSATQVRDEGEEAVPTEKMEESAPEADIDAIKALAKKIFEGGTPAEGVETELFERFPAEIDAEITALNNETKSKADIQKELEEKQARLEELRKRQQERANQDRETAKTQLQEEIDEIQDRIESLIEEGREEEAKELEKEKKKLAGELEALGQNEGPKIKGAFQRTPKSVITLLDKNNADVTTPIHELAHEFEGSLSEEELKAIEEWSGHRRGTVEFSEAFAVGAERYIYEGPSGDVEVDSIFKRLAKWFQQVIEDAATYFGSINELNEDMQLIYDKMFLDGLVGGKNINGSLEAEIRRLDNLDGNQTAAIATVVTSVRDKIAEKMGLTREEYDEISAYNTVKSLGKTIENNKGKPLEDILFQSEGVREEVQGGQNLVQVSKAFNEGVEAVAKLANEYKKEFGIDSVQHSKVNKLFPAVSRMISEAYEQAETEMTTEEVKEAYKALEEETLQQYKFIVDKGLKVSRWTEEGEPYPNSKSMLKDVRENNHLYFLPNSEAFGKEGDEVEGRAGLKLTDVYLDDGYRMTLSEVFRVVHDYFGHGILGNQFGAVGEENATLQHLDLYSSKALPAVVFQTRGQNSWVNFSGVNNEALRKIREGSRTNNKSLLEEGQKEFRFATPKDNILPKIFNFKTYETARRINEQEEIRKSETYLDPRGTHEDTYISDSLSRHTLRNSGKLNGFSRRSLGVSKRLGGYDVEVIAEYEGNKEVDKLIKDVFPRFKGTQKIYEITNGEVYRELMIEALETNKFKSSVTVHSAEDFSNMRLFVTEDGSTGITLTKDGFLGGAFGNPKANRPNNLAQMMLLGIKEGAITAEAFDTVLPDYYSTFGFKAVSRTAFNEEYRPLKENGALEDWDYELYSKFNNGRPDVVFFIYDGGDRGSIQNRIGQFDSYSEYQKDFTEYYDKDSYDGAYRFMEVEAINKSNYQNQEVNSQILWQEEYQIPEIHLIYADSIGLDIDDVSELGSGEFGTAYSTGDGRVIKVTTSAIEAQLAQQLMRNEGGAVKIYDVKRVDNEFIILQEEVDTDSSIEDDYYTVEHILDSVGLSITELDYLDYDDLSKEMQELYDENSEFIEGLMDVMGVYSSLGVYAMDISPDNLGYDSEGRLVGFDFHDKSQERMKADDVENVEDFVYDKRTTTQKALEEVVEKTEAVEIEAVPEGVYLNVGMKVGQTEETITIEDIKKALPEGVEIEEYRERRVESDGGIEETSLIRLSRDLSDIEMRDFLKDTGQMAIPKISDGEGVMYGTTDWGPFNPTFFYMPNGQQLSELMEEVENRERDALFHTEQRHTERNFEDSVTVYRGIRGEFSEGFKGVQYFSESPNYARAFGENVEKFELNASEVLDLEEWNKRLGLETAGLSGQPYLTIHEDHINNPKEWSRYLLRGLLNNTELSDERIDKLRDEFESSIEKFAVIRGEDLGNKGEIVYAVRDKSKVRPSNNEIRFQQEGPTQQEIDNEDAKLQEDINQLQAEIEELGKELETEQPSEGFINSHIQIIKNKIRELIGSNEYTKEYLGEEASELIKRKPSKKDVDKFTELMGRISKEGMKTLELTRSRLEDVDVPATLAEEGFTQAEIEEFVDLNKKLGNWNVLDGVSEYGTSVADLLSILKQYESALAPEAFKKAMVQKDYHSVKSAEDKEMRNFDSASPLQSPDTVKAKNTKQGTEISHMEVTTLATAVRADSIVELKKNGDEVEVNPETMKEEGRTFLIRKGDQEMKVSIGRYARLVVDKDKVREMVQDSDLKLVDYGSTTNFDIYERVGETEEFVPMKGDFSYGKEKINYGEVDSLKEGQRLNLKVDTNDPYNKKLIKEYNRKSKKASEAEKEGLRADFINRLHIYLTTENGELLGSMRALYDEFNPNSQETASLRLIRENAASYILEDGLSGEIDVEMTVPVNKVLMGSPNFIVREAEDGSLVPDTMEITPQALKTIKAAGVWSNGKLQLNRKGLETKSNTMFLRGMEGNVPVIVFEYQGKNIAFPVSLVGTVTDQRQLVLDIFELDLREVEKIQLVNRLMAEKGINPADNVLDPTAPLGEGANRQVIERILEQFAEVEEFYDPNVWKNENFSLSLLQDQARISIDLTNRPLGTSKVVMKLQEFDTYSPDKIKSTVFGGQTEVEKLRDLDKAFRELDSYADRNGMYLADTLNNFMETLLDEATLISGEVDSWIKGRQRLKSIKKVLNTKNTGRNQEFNRMVEELRKDVASYERDVDRNKRFNKVTSKRLKDQMKNNTVVNCK